MQFSNRGRGNVPYNSYQRQFNNQVSGQRGHYQHYISNSRGRSPSYSRGNGRGSYNNAYRGRDYQVRNENRSSYETRGRGNNHRVFYTDQLDDHNEPMTSKPIEMQFFRSET